MLNKNINNKNMPRSPESRPDEDDIPEYRTAKGERGLVFSTPGEISKRLSNQERLKKSQELGKATERGTTAVVWNEIDGDYQHQQKLMDEGKKYNGQLLENLLDEEKILKAVTEQARYDVEGWNGFIESGGNQEDYWKLQLQEMSAEKIIPFVEKDLALLESKEQLSEDEQKELATRRRLIEKLGREAQRTKK